MMTMLISGFYVHSSGQNLAHHTKKALPDILRQGFHYILKLKNLKGAHHPDTAGAGVGAEATGNAFFVVRGVLPAAIQS